MKQVYGYFQRSVASQIVGTILVASVIVFTFLIYFSAANYEKNIYEKSENYLLSKLESETERLNTSFVQIQLASEVLATLVAEDRSNNAELIFKFFTEVMKQEPLIVGGGFWMEPYSYKNDEKYFGPFLYRVGTDVEVSWEYSNEEGNYFQYSWYQNGFLGRGSIWSEVYTDAVTGVSMITVTSPINRDGKTIGVTTVDIDLEEMNQHVSDIQIGRRGHAFVVSPDGYFVSNEGHLDQRNIASSNLAEYASTILNSEKSTMIQGNLDDGDYFISYGEIGDTGLKLILAFPEKELAIQETILYSVLISIGGLILFFFIIFALMRSLVIKSLQVTTEYAEIISEGDFSQDLVGKFSMRKDEFGRLGSAFNQMTDNLKGMFGQVKDLSNQTAAGSEELSALGEQVGEIAGQVGTAIQTIAAGAEEQSAQIEQVTANVENMIQQIQQIGQRSEKMDQAAGFMMGNIESGNEAIQHSIEQVNHVKDDAIKVAEVVSELGNTSEQIGDIIQLVSNIASQTNLLALNAAIEAARAGEAGRGFSVVADEIRNLAEESANATGKIADLIYRMQSDTVQAVQMINNSNQVIDESVLEIEESGKIYREIFSVAKDLRGLISLVTNNAREMVTDSSMVEKVINEIASISQEFASNSEEVAASSEEQVAAIEEMVSSSKQLTELAENLLESVNKFKLS